MKTYEQLKTDIGLTEDITSSLFKLARASADFKALTKKPSKRNPHPLEKRMLNKFIGRHLAKIYR
jgi:hypothetical protein